MTITLIILSVVFSVIAGISIISLEKEENVSIGIQPIQIQPLLKDLEKITIYNIVKAFNTTLGR